MPLCHPVGVYGVDDTPRAGRGAGLFVEEGLGESFTEGVAAVDVRFVRFER